MIVQRHIAICCAFTGLGCSEIFLVPPALETAGTVLLLNVDDESEPDTVSGVALPPSGGNIRLVAGKVPYDIALYFEASPKLLGWPISASV